VTSSRRYVTSLPTSRVIRLVRLLLAVDRVTANLCYTWPPLKSRYVTWGALQVLYAIAFAFALDRVSHRVPGQIYVLSTDYGKGEIHHSEYLLN